MEIASKRYRSLDKQRTLGLPIILPTTSKGWYFRPEFFYMDLDTPRVVKHLLQQIYDLNKKGKGCYASNKWFANYYGYTVDAIRNKIYQLRDKNLIVLHGTGSKRRITINEKEIEKLMVRKDGPTFFCPFWIATLRNIPFDYKFVLSHLNYYYDMNKRKPVKITNQAIAATFEVSEYTVKNMLAKFKYNDYISVSEIRQQQKSKKDDWWSLVALEYQKKNRNWVTDRLITVEQKNIMKCTESYDDVEKSTVERKILTGIWTDYKNMFLKTIGERYFTSKARDSKDFIHMTEMVKSVYNDGEPIVEPNLFQKAIKESIRIYLKYYNIWSEFKEKPKYPLLKQLRMLIQRIVFVVKTYVDEFGFKEDFEVSDSYVRDKLEFREYAFTE